MPELPPTHRKAPRPRRRVESGGDVNAALFNGIQSLLDALNPQLKPQDVELPLPAGEEMDPRLREKRGLPPKPAKRRV